MKKLLTLLSLINFLCSVAQENEKIETDRPNETQTAALVPKGMFQGESGLELHWDKEKNTKTIFHPASLWKYGLSNHFELRLVTEFASEEQPLIIPQGNEIISGLHSLQLGGKIHITEQRGILPKSSVLLQSNIPGTGSDKFGDESWEPELRLAMQNNLSKKIELGYNTGIHRDGESHQVQWLYSISPSFELSDKWKGFVEIYGDLERDHLPHHTMDAGFLFLLSKNAQLDIAGGIGLNSASNDFITLGFSFRL